MENSFHQDSVQLRCMDNDTQEEGELENPLEKLQIFFAGIQGSISLKSFPFLSELMLFNQSVEIITDLQVCPNLKILWICECHIMKIEKLTGCSKLEELYLYDNKIKRIENLDHLNNLRVLWLNDNQIRCVEGLSQLTKLKSLNLSGNEIAFLKGELVHLNNLECLYISGNLIGVLNDLLGLSSLPNLRSLSINEPGYEPNPICSNPNLPLILLYFLPRLRTLDQVNCEVMELRNTVRAVMQSKQSYYRMQMHSFMAKEERITSALTSTYKKIHDKIYSQITVLDKALRCLQARNTDKVKSGTTSSEYDAYLLSPWIKEVQLRIVVWENLLKKYKAELHTGLEVIARRKALRERLIQLELESCGYLKVVEVDIKDDWLDCFGSFLASRCCAHELLQIGIVGLKICRVYRIINNFSSRPTEETEDSFDEEQLWVQELSCKPGERKQSWHDYAFILRPLGDQEVDYYISVVNKKPNKHGPPIKLTKSLTLADKDNLKGVARKHGDPSSHYFATFLVMRILDKNDCSSIQGNSDNCTYRVPIVKSGEIHGPIATRKVENKSCFCRNGMQVFQLCEDVAATAEFFVEVQYLSVENKMQLHLATVSPKAELTDLLPGEELRNDIALLKRIPLKTLKPVTNELTDCLFTNSPEQMSQRRGETALALLDIKLPRSTNFQQYTSLTQLAINHCHLRLLPTLTNIPLQALDVSHNLLHTLTTLSHLPKLKTLNVNYNILTNLTADINALRSRCSQVQELSLQMNPWRKPHDLRSIVTASLSSIETIDDQLVTEEERQTALNAFQELNNIFLELVSARSFSLVDNISQFTVFPTAKHCAIKSDVCNVKQTILWTNIVALCLANCRLRNLEGFHMLNNLRFICLDDNYLEDLNGITACTKLEEISANGNSLTQIDLASLKKLRSLLLENNSIKSLTSLQKCSAISLEVLVIGNNAIQRLEGLEACTNLKELYVANNDIKELKTVMNLRSLQLLTVVDFSGNPLVKEVNNYRLRIIYYLKLLRALDGEDIQANEILRAKELFGGHLSYEFLMEKFTNTKFSELVCLDVPSSSIKVIDILPSEHFVQLQSVNLEKNNLTSFGGLLFLPQLRVLCLNENNIESLFPAHIQTGGSASHKKFKNPADAYYVSLYASKQPVFPQLKVLHLAKNQITSLLPFYFHRMPSLTSLFLQYNEISSISGLENLKELRELVLDGNKIKEISELPLHFKWSLQELHLENNRVRELRTLRELENLRRVYLACNKLYDLNDLERFVSVQRNLIEISLIDNPITTRQLHRLILVHGCLHLKCIDGILITSEERERCAAFYADMELQSLITTGVLPPALPTSAQTTRNMCEPVLPGISSSKFNPPPAKQVASSMSVMNRGKPKFSASTSRSQALGVEKLPPSLKLTRKESSCDLYIRGTNCDPLLSLNTNVNMDVKSIGHALITANVPGMSIYPAQVMSSPEEKQRKAVNVTSRPNSVPNFLNAQRF